MKTSSISILFIGSLFIISIACRKEIRLPTVSTIAVSHITDITAVSGGNITHDGGGPVVVRGLVWSTNLQPILESNNGLTTEGTGAGVFSSTLTGLTAGTNYYVRAYATNSIGTAYGTDMSFSTIGQAPQCISQPASIVSASEAVLNGTVNANDISTEVSFEYGTDTTYGRSATANQSPFTGHTITNVSANISGLALGTTYHFRIKAVNTLGTAFGNDLSFTTLNIPSLSTKIISSITVNTALSGGIITSDGGYPVTLKGVCWNTIGFPTVDLSTKTIDGSGTDEFVSLITELTYGTTYYLRAYSTNSAGTAYGNQQSFTTDAIHFNPNLTYGSVIDIDGNIYKTIQIGTQIWMAENLKTTRYNDGSEIQIINDNTSWPSDRFPRFCWYKNDKESYKDIFGALYNWPAVNTEKLCPIGWHVPSSNEWFTMILFLDASAIDFMYSQSDVASGKLKEVSTYHWLSPNTEATNESGFTALPGGKRNGVGAFLGEGEIATWWMSGNESRSIFYENTNVSGSEGATNEGRSVRCLKE